MWHCGAGRDNHPGPRALVGVAGPAQRLAVDGDYIALAQQGRDVGQRPAECRHLGARRRAAEHRHERDDEQLAKVMPGVLSAGIGDVLEYGQE